MSEDFMKNRYELAGKTNAELTVLLNETGDPRRVGFDDCSTTAVCRTHAIDKLLVLAGHPDEVWSVKKPHASLEEIAALGLNEA